MAAPASERPALGKEIVFPHLLTPNGLALAKSGQPHPFLTLAPDEPHPPVHPQFTPDGHFLIWGGEDGTFHVADMDQVRTSLEAAGFPGW
jgi:hypothetical protein